MPYDYKPYPYVAPPGLTAPEPRHRVIVVGAGPVGLAMALELASRGVASVLLDESNVVATGSRAIGWSRRSLQIFDRLGIADSVLDRAAPWRVGRICHGDDEICSFDLGGDPDERMPPFANLQQYHLEALLVARAAAEPRVDLRFKNRVIAIDQAEEGVEVTVRTPDGPYRLTADYVVACDGARSPIRAMLGLDFEGQSFEERFLIADIEMEADFPSERWFWFQPSFHDGGTALLHRQADNVYRLDLPLGRDADPAEEARPERVIPRIEKVVGPDFELDWVSVYSFRCGRLKDFVHGRVIFAGDSAHLVPPFGARGGNGGLQDVDNLGWKLAAVLDGRAPVRLIDSYNRERVAAAEENIRQSARAARFIAPAPGVERLFRDQVLALARKAPFAGDWVNSGRPSEPFVCRSDAPDDPMLPVAARPGNVAPDAPQGNGWLMSELGRDVRLIAVNARAPAGVEIPVLEVRMNDAVRARYLGGAPQALYLVRPDQVIAARWIEADPHQIAGAVRSVWEGRW